MTKMREISEELINKLANYLATKPYAEVFVLLAELGKLKQVVTSEKSE